MALVAALGIATASGAAATMLAPPTAAAAVSPLKPACKVAGFFSGALGKICSLAQKATGFLGSASPVASSVSTGLALAAVVAWVTGGASFALKETAKVLGETTTPRLSSTWFSASYWRVAGIAALLTVPFLFAAAIQALIRSDLALLIRAAIGYLPLAMLAVSVAAPVTVLLLAASDQISGLVTSAAGQVGPGFLTKAAEGIGAFAALSRSPFLAFFCALLTVAGAMLLWLELLVREAAVYVIVLMLPLAFAAMVWPARRLWLLRTVEVLVALIMSKFVIVAVLALGGAALAHAALGSLTAMISGAALLAMAVCAPWALLRLVPMAEIAAGAAASLRGDFRQAQTEIERAVERATGEDRRSAAREGSDGGPTEWAQQATSDMRRARDAVPGEGQTSATGAQRDDSVVGAEDGNGLRDPLELGEQVRPAPAVVPAPGGQQDGAQAAAAAQAGGDPSTDLERPAGSESRDPTLDAVLGAEDLTMSLAAGTDGSPPRWKRTAERSGEIGEIHDPTPAPQPDQAG